MINGGIFGPKLSGKTTLAMALSRQFWQQYKIKTIVLDLNGDNWGEHATATNDEEIFWQVVWKAQNCLIIVDEAAETINRDKKLIPVFTRMRHNNHKLIVVGHSGMNLLPIMREQIDTIYLFRQGEKAAAYWSEIMAEKGLLQACELPQYTFIKLELYGKPQRLKLAPPKVSTI
jgi:hypothetical protein